LTAGWYLFIFGDQTAEKSVALADPDSLCCMLALSVPRTGDFRAAIVRMQC
jgi:hypothetical protein